MLNKIKPVLHPRSVPYLSDCIGVAKVNHVEAEDIGTE